MADVFDGDRDFIYYYYLDEEGKSLSIREHSFCGINGSIRYIIEKCTDKELALNRHSVESVGGGSMFGDWEEEMRFTRK